MRVGFIYAYMDNRRWGNKYGGPIQPMTGTLIASLLPAGIEIEVINDNSPGDVDWRKDYDLLFISSIHSDFDRARQISHYWRKRGAKTVYGGFMASTYTALCQPFFDSIVVGDAEGCIPELYRDFCAGELRPVYVSSHFDPLKVPTPRFDLLAKKNLIPLTLEITRGCPFTCDFCALTGIGTRFHTRPPELVVRDVKAGQAMLRGLVPDYKLHLATFLDNNIGGNLRYLEQLCEALTPLNLRWGSQATFNVMAKPEVVKMMSRAGCRVIFMGLESLNPATLSDMHKYQNTLDQTKKVLDLCGDHGIMVASGLLLSPVVDDLDYIYSLPPRLKDCGLHMPAYICFESPIPGTPHFHRLAAEEKPALLPNALLRDFAGYTLVTKPKRESPEDFVAGYQWLMENVYTPQTRWERFSEYVPRYLKGRQWFSLLAEFVRTGLGGEKLHPDRTFLAGTDVPPPESLNVPFAADDFDSEAQRRAIVEPWRVTDETGRVLPMWRESTKVFQAQGRMAVSLEELTRTLDRKLDISLLTVN
jgi:hypothetical protein